MVLTQLRYYVRCFSVGLYIRANYRILQCNLRTSASEYTICACAYIIMSIILIIFLFKKVLIFI